MHSVTAVSFLLRVGLGFNGSCFDSCRNSFGCVHFAPVSSDGGQRVHPARALKPSRQGTHTDVCSTSGGSLRRHCFHSCNIKLWTGACRLRQTRKMLFFTVVWFQSGPLSETFTDCGDGFTEASKSFVLHATEYYSSVVINMIVSFSPPSSIFSPGSRGVVPGSSAHCCSSPC